MKRKKKKRTAKKRKATKAKKSRKAKRKQRRFKTSYHEHTSKLYARKRREDVRKYGSVSAARKARREQRDRDWEHRKADRAAWKAAFTRRHGHPPDEFSDEFDYNYTWRDRYAAWENRSAPPPPSPARASSAAAPRTARQEHLIPLLRTMAERGATEGERAAARERLKEMGAA